MTPSRVTIETSATIVTGLNYGVHIVKEYWPESVVNNFGV